MFYINRIRNRHARAPRYSDSSSDDLPPMLLHNMVPGVMTPPSTPVETTEFNEQLPGVSGLSHVNLSGVPRRSSSSSDSDDWSRVGVSGSQTRRHLLGEAPRAAPEDDDNDEFFEAEDHSGADGASLSTTSEVNLHRALEDCQRAMSLFFNNNLDEAIAIMIPWKDISLYHAHGAAIFEFIPAMLTLDPIQVRNANDALRRTFELCSPQRRNYSLVQSISAIIKKPNYGGYTEEEAHAELIHAEAVLLQSCLGVLEGEEIGGFLRASLRIKTAYASYKNCAKILLRKQWENETCKAHFESGVRLGLATFNVMLSLLPPRVISVLEMIGFSADKEKGIEELMSGVKSPGLRSVLCELTLLIYYLVIGHFAAILPDYTVTEQLISNGLRKYPNSVWFMMFKARMQLLRGMIPEAVETYQVATRTSNLWPQLKHLCYWEMIWAYAIMMDWSEATWYAAKLASDSKWSRTIYMYTQAVMNLERGDGLTADQRKQSALLLRKATSYRQRLLGRSLPMEKFVIRRCDRWIRRGYLALPGIELMCLWSIFPSLAAEPHYADQMLKVIEKTTDEIDAVLTSKTRDTSKKVPNYDKEDLALVRFLHGCLLSAMSLPRLALRHLEFVLTMKDEIKDGSHLIPYATVEIAMCHYTLGDPYRAIELLQEARKKYTGYLLESRLHFRIHSKLELIHAGASATVVAGTTASAVALSSVNALSTRPSTYAPAIASTSTGIRATASTSSGIRSHPTVDAVIRANRSPFVAIRVNPNPLEDIMANPGPLDGIRANPGSLEEITADPSTNTEARANLSTSTATKPSTSAETRANPSTSAGTSANPSTSAETRANPSTSAGTRAIPSTSAGTRAIPTTSAETTANPSSSAGTRANLNSSSGTRSNPSTSSGTSANPSTSAETRANPSTSAGTRAIPSTSAGTRAIPTTSAETTANPSSSAGTRANLNSSSGTRSNPSTSSGTSANPSTSAETRVNSSTSAGTSANPSTSAGTKGNSGTSAGTRAIASTSVGIRSIASTSAGGRVTVSTSATRT